MVNFYKLFLRDGSHARGSISYYVACISMIIIPVYYWFLPPVMILWFFLILLDIRLFLAGLKNISLNYKILFFSFILFYIWQIIGMLYSDNTDAGWRNIVLRLSLFLFPFVLILPGELIRKNVNKLLKIFSLSTFFFIVICFGYAVYRSINFKNGIWIFNPHPPIEDWLNYFYASEFAIFQHPSYLSMYALFSFFISSELFFDKKTYGIRKIFWLIEGVSLIISIYLLSSRAEILATFITIPVYFVYKFKIGDIKKILSLLALLVLIFFFILLPVLKSNPRFSHYFNDESKDQLTGELLKESRLVIWKSSINIVHNNFVFGVGTGDIQDELNKEYQLEGVKVLAIASNLNAHNQFLEVLIENGFIGILLFLWLFGIMLYVSLKEANTIYLMFILIAFISFLFETMLNRLAGVSFFPLFSFLLIHGDKKNLVTATDFNKRIE